MNLNTLAKRMIFVAELHPINPNQVIENIANATFPPNLCKTVELDKYGMTKILFSIETLVEGKAIRHLSFSMMDLSTPTQEMKDDFRAAFYGDERNVMILKSLHKHCVQMAVIFDRDINRN